MYYEVSKQGELIGAKCACDECRAGQRGELHHRYGEGHFKCSIIPTGLLEAEERGEITAVYDDGSWKWFVRVCQSCMSCGYEMRREPSPENRAWPTQ